jgi:hypothetical protein
MSIPLSAAPLHDPLASPAPSFFDSAASETARLEFNDQVSQYKVIGVIIMIASTILALAAVSSSLWLLAVGSIVPFMIGREVLVIGSNAKEFVDYSIQRSQTHYAQINRSVTEFADKVGASTCVMGCLLNCFPAIISGLHEGYLNVFRVNP